MSGPLQNLCGNAEEAPTLGGIDEGWELGRFNRSYKPINVSFPSAR